MTTATLSQKSQPVNHREVLSVVFGFEGFRDGQEQVVRTLLEGRSAVSIFPTGSGKSLCYQLPALMLEGLTVVISPLIALMKDQLDFLQRKNIPAARIDSSMSREETLAVYDDLRAGRLRLLYISPERLGNERFLQLLEHTRISILAVDEAHCISEWGHNFRPDYLRIAALSKRLQAQRVLALTATATPEVASDIARAFEIAPQDIVHTGFYRPNLQLHVTACTADERPELLVERLKQRPRGPAIVYVTLQRTAEQTAALLASRGFYARAYHAGMAAEERTAVQESFMAADDMIVVATIAFGMGIDKANIRAVYHYNLPKSLEGYQQEIGRAGRDGKPAVCEILACRDDLITLENFSYGDTPTTESIESIVGELLQGQERLELSVYDLSHRYDVRELVVKTLLTYLELEGILQPTGPFYTEYKFKPVRSSAEILAQFNSQRADFLKSIFQCARKGKTWLFIDVAAASRSLGEPRDRIVAALDYLDQTNNITLQATGVRLGYQVLRKPADRHALVAKLNERFQRREQQDIARIAKVVALAETPECLTRFILEYFGEHRDKCGHCCRCAGENAVSLPASSDATISEDARLMVRRLVTERHDELSAPRQLARYLCGIVSPATARNKLRKRPEFGRLEQTPFTEVLRLAEQTLASTR